MFIFMLIFYLFTHHRVAGSWFVRARLSSYFWISFLMAAKTTTQSEMVITIIF